MPAAAVDRTFMRIDTEYSLCGPYGRVAPNTHSGTWFFELPRARDADEAWRELLNRMFYDANVRLRRREPDDANWLNLESFARSPVDVAAALASGGSSWEALPWYAAERHVVWEGSPCYFVDDAGQYDLLAASDFTELVLSRLLHAGKIDEAGFVAFFDHLSALAGQPPLGRKYYADRAKRFANLVTVRPATFYRRPPGERPWISGPPDPAVL